MKYYNYITKEFLFESRRKDLHYCVSVRGCIVSKCRKINSAAKAMVSFDKLGYDDVELIHVESEA